MDHTRYLVIGAGVSGLAFTDWIQSDDYIICEALNEIGGYCRTIKKDGFVWDFSGHFFHFNRPEIEQYLRSRMGDQKIRTVVKEARIFHKDRLIDFPFQKNIHQLPREDFIDCLVDLFERNTAPATNFKEMLYAKFGKSIADLFLVPYNQKLYATELENLDVHAMGRFFPHADISEIIGNFRKPDKSSYNATFTYPQGGAIQYIQALAKGVKSENIRLEARVIGVDLDKKVAQTTRGDISFEHLISSAPFPQLLKMTSTEYEPEIYNYNKVLVFNLGFDRKGLEGIHWIYFADPSLVFYRVGFYDNIFNTDRMSLYVEIGYPASAKIDAEERAQAKSRVLKDLKRCGIVDAHELVAEHCALLDPAYVHMQQRAQEDVRNKKSLLTQKGVHSIGRYGSWTYCSIEDNIVEARNLAGTLSP